MTKVIEKQKGLSAVRYTEQALLDMCAAASKAKGERLSVSDFTEKRHGITTTLMTINNRFGSLNELNIKLGFESKPAVKRKKAVTAAPKPTGAQKGRLTLAHSLRLRVEAMDGLEAARKNLKRAGVELSGYEQDIEQIRESIFMDLRKF